MTGSKPFDFGADPDPEILAEFLQLQDRDNCMKTTRPKSLIQPPDTRNPTIPPALYLSGQIFKTKATVYKDS